MTDFKGLILELRGNQATVMTDKCDFITIKRQPEMFVGQQIKFSKSDIHTAMSCYVKYMALTACVLFLIFFYAFYYQFSVSKTVYAYIDIDINPSLEFTIDKNAQVLDIKPLNKDAQILLKDLKLLDMPVKQAITEVVKESEKLGFIKPNVKNAVLIYTSINEGKNYKQNKSKEKVLDNILTDIGSATFDVGSEKIKPVVLKVTSEYRNLAAKNEISMGRYALYNKLREKGINITVEEAKTVRVSDMLDKTLIDNVKDFIPETENSLSQDNINSNGDEPQLDKKEEKNKNTETSSVNAEGQKNKNKTDENKQNMDQGKNKDSKNSNNNSSNASASGDLNANTDQSAIENQNNKASDNTNSGTSKDESASSDQGTPENQNNKAGDSSNSGTSKDKSGNPGQGTTKNKNNKAGGSSNSGTGKDKNK